MKLKHLKRFNEELDMETLKSASKVASDFNHHQKSKKLLNWADQNIKVEGDVFILTNYNNHTDKKMKFVKIHKNKKSFLDKEIKDIFTKRWNYTFEFLDLLKDESKILNIDLVGDKWIYSDLNAKHIFSDDWSDYYFSDRKEAKRFWDFIKENHKNIFDDINSLGRFSVNSLMFEVRSR
jgi:hypothetical protein